MVTMASPLTYYGGKGYLARRITAVFPEHRVYVEPFCGGAAVLFAKARAKLEIVNDIDTELVNFFRILRAHPAELARLCRLTPYARAELIAALDSSEDSLERARRFWVRSTQAFGGRPNHSRSWSIEFDPNGKGTMRPRVTRNRIERFQMAADRLADVFIEQGNALELIERADRADAVIYCDPPYLFEARGSSDKARAKGSGYIHEFGEEDDHRRLAEVLRSCRGTVFLSGYPSDLYDELYRGWHQLQWTVRSRFSNSRGVPTVKVTEVLWSNRVLAGQLSLGAVTRRGESA